ncbi:2OG-Fe(II) oxygenase superfamily protein [Xylariales sp. PMI_506]|nr:2OG-Fe(II) oxygenase superfamily protein [Xylariales sp. PMI_506]
MSTTITTEPAMAELRLKYGADIVTRQVSTKPPRDCVSSEVPVIDLSGIDGDFSQRSKIADEVRYAAGQLGFFFIKNHGIDEEVIQRAHDQALRFFKQSQELKAPVAKRFAKYPNNGWSGRQTTFVSAGEGPDFKEGFGWSYTPAQDPLYENQPIEPDVFVKRNHDEPYLWDETSHLDRFKEDTWTYWKSCLNLARKLNRIFALSLDLEEDYFDSVTTFPGADGVYNYYPAVTNSTDIDPMDFAVGLGSHTDFQCFTLLWQDMSGGLQLLNNQSEWIWATPIAGTIVVNIGDFLARLTNDRYKSTVHRAYHRGRSERERISMPFFFGFNFDAECAVLPSCVDEEHPAKYEPITCGKWRELRFGITNTEANGMKRFDNY